MTFNSHNAPYQHGNIPALDTDTIQICWVNLERVTFPLEMYYHVLSSDEKTRVERFNSVQKQRHFIMSRGILRYLLGGYLSLSPTDISFTYTEYGKPQFTPEIASSQISFNLSYAGSFILYAFAIGCTIGVDVQSMDPLTDSRLNKLLIAAFQNTNREYIYQQSPQEQRILFYKGWTQKEAVIKAVGSGLSTDLKSFSVDLRVASQIVSLTSPEHLWQVRTIASPCGYMASVADDGFNLSINQWCITQA